MKCLLAVHVAFLFCTLSHAADEPLRAGFGETDVSPKLGGAKPVYMAGFSHDRKATAQHDPIMARAVVLAYEKQKIAMVCVDVVGLFHATSEAVRKELPEFTYVLVSSTHNHEGPDTIGLWGANYFSSGINPDYMKQLEAGIVKAVKQADANLQPVTAKIGEIKAPQLLHDSRLPICLHDDLVVLEFTHAETKKRHGILVQWNCHPEALGSKNTQISADFVAGTVKQLAQSQGCPVAYFTGTVGGLLSPATVKVPGPDGKLLEDQTFERTEGYGRLVATEAEKALKAAQPLALTPFDIRSRDIHVPATNNLYRLGWAAGVLKRDLFIWEDTPYPEKPQIANDLKKPTAIQTEVGYLKLGDLDVAVIPGEIYPELVLSKVEDPPDKGADFPDAPIEPGIYAQMKGKHKMIIGLGNDELGYIIPKRQWDEKPPFCYGLKKAQYGEINSCGPDTAPVICKAFADLVNGTGPKKMRRTAAPPKKYAVKADYNITYYEVRNDPDADRHKLDVYRPSGKGPYPVLLFIHGGAWMSESKDDYFGIYGYGTIARCFAERGIVVIVPNYRLSPGVRHPEHIKDIARAFDWAHRHCAEYGGDPKQLFVGGHSAGGHLAALLATDETYLKEVGRTAKEIRGVIGVSGVYRVDGFDMKLCLESSCKVVKVTLDIRPSAIIFGDDAEVVRKASPLNHVHPGLPPFLLLNAGCDYPPLPRMAKDFAAALKKDHCDVELKVIPRRTHETMLFDIARLSAEPAAVEAIVKFIEEH